MVQIWVHLMILRLVWVDHELHLPIIGWILQREHRQQHKVKVPLLNLQFFGVPQLPQRRLARMNRLLSPHPFPPMSLLVLVLVLILVSFQTKVSIVR